MIDEAWGMDMASVTLMGLGVLGSFAAPLLARSNGLVEKLTLVDPDRYEASNLAGQLIDRRDVGRPKVLAQARRVRAMAPGLEVVALASRLEDVPPGRLRSDLVLTCLDSREARIAANEIAWSLGVPLIDAGVRGSDLLGRIDVYVPGAGQPCYECTLSDADYAGLDITYSCEGRREYHAATTRTAPPSATPASLGAWTAAIQVSEAVRLLRSTEPSSLAGRRILVEGQHHRHAMTRLPFNRDCRRSPHDPQVFERLDGGSAGAFTLGSLCDRVTGANPRATEVRVFGSRWVTEVACPSCGSARRTVRLERGLGGSRGWCRRCERAMEVTSRGLVEWLSLGLLGARERGRAVRSFGLASGDLVTVRAGGTEHHVELNLPRRTLRAAETRIES